MTSAEILVDAFGRVQETVHEVVRGLTSSQLAERLAPDANSIAWLVWHLTRVQDDHVADAFGVPQVWTEYGKRFELPLEPYDTGYGHTSEQVAQVTVPSADLLTGYQDAVHEQTVRLVSGITDPDLDRVVDEALGPAGDAGRAAGQRDRRLRAARRPGRVHPGHPAAALGPARYGPVRNTAASTRSASSAQMTSRQ